MNVVTSELREVLAAVAQLMLPGGADLPSAASADVAGARLDAVLVARPDLAEPLVSLLERLRPLTPANALDQVVSDDGEDHELLALVVVGGYMMAPEVGSALQYPGQQPKPVNPFDINDVVDDGLLDSVLERGAIYRPTPHLV